MPRFTDPLQIAALQAQNVSVALSVGFRLVDGNFIGFTTAATQQFFVGAGFCEPLGSLLSFEVVEDGATVEARGCKFTISGINPQYVAAFQSSYKVLQAAWMWLSITDASGNQIVGYPLFAGVTDQPTINIDGGKAEIQIALESTLASLKMPCGRRYTLQDAQVDHPGDVALQFIPSIQEVEIYWGRIPGKSSGMWLGLVSGL